MGEPRGCAKGGRGAEKDGGVSASQLSSTHWGFLLERAGGVSQPWRAILGWLWFPRDGFILLEKNEQEKQNNWNQESVHFIPAF